MGTTPHSSRTMKDIYKDEEIIVPEGVTLEIKSRAITVSGPRGTLKKAVKRINMDIRLVNVKAENRAQKVKLVVWHGARKHVACLRTVRSLIENMITGVTKGFRYKLRAVYAHFPINIIIQDSGKAVEIRNFLGEKLARQVARLEGDDIENVSQSAASIHGACLVKNKDIRKFLDGVYVSEKTTVEQQE